MASHPTSPSPNQRYTQLAHEDIQKTQPISTQHGDTVPTAAAEDTTPYQPTWLQETRPHQRVQPVPPVRQAITDTQTMLLNRTQPNQTAQQHISVRLIMLAILAATIAFVLWVSDHDPQPVRSIAPIFTVTPDENTLYAPILSPAPFAIEATNRPIPTKSFLPPLPDSSENRFIWQRCNINSRPVQAILILFNGDFVFTPDDTIANAILSLTGERILWDEETGFAIDEDVSRILWYALNLADGSNRYVMIGRGQRTGDFYAFATDSRDEYVADYGGVESWHVRCGGWRLDDQDSIERLHYLFQDARRQPAPDSTP